MLDDLFIIFDQWLVFIKDHPVLSFLWTIFTGVVALVWRYTGDIKYSEIRKEKRKAKIEAEKKKKIRDDVEQLLSGHQSRSFTFGRLSADVHVVDFQLTGYPRASIVSTRITASWKVPKQYEQCYRESLSKYQAKLAAKEIFEGKPGLAPKKIILDRTQGDEAKMIRIEYDQSPSYVHHRAASEVYRGLESSARSALAAEPLVTMDPFFSNSFGVIVAVITSDSQLVFIERGGATAVNHQKIVCGAVEGMTIQDLQQEYIDPYQAAMRAIDEELGLKLEPTEYGAIKITACLFNDAHHEWNLVGYVDLRPFDGKYTSLKLLEKKTTAQAHDSWEVRDLVFIDFEPTKVAGYLLAFDDRVVNYAKAAAVLALLCAYGNTEKVSAAFSHSFD